MSIFNSLGSNYDLGFVIRTLFASNNGKSFEKLKKFLENKYKGNTILVYKGREALRVALRIINKKDSLVAICGFTCFAVYDAVVKEGYKVEYLDIEKNSLNFSFETFKKHVEKTPQIKIAIIQNTLSFPCEVEKIAKFCKEKNIILIEDLAHSVGAIYRSSKEAGSFGDFTVLSFSQDKIIDGISGGALIVQSSKFKVQSYQITNVNMKQQIIDKFYPLFTYKIRKTYDFGVGKILHFVLKKFGLLSNPMKDSGEIHSLPNWYCGLIYKEFINLEKNLSHRKKITDIYLKNINKKLLFDVSYIDISYVLRFPIFVENRQGLIKYLKKNNIFVSDIWYDAPIAPKKYLNKTNYENQCPVSERISNKILNLPTHKNISKQYALFISEKINQWLISQ